MQRVRQVVNPFSVHFSGAGQPPVVHEAAQVIHNDGLGKVLQQMHACGILLEVCSCLQVPDSSNYDGTLHISEKYSGYALRRR